MSVGFYCVLPYGNNPEQLKQRITEFYQNDIGKDFVGVYLGDLRQFLRHIDHSA